MLNNLKQAIETWLRGIVADEVAIAVSPINTSLNAERTAMVNIFASTCADVNSAVDRLSNISHFVENQTLRDHIRDLGAKFTEVTHLIEKLHPSVVKK
jgi:hypothetical protein